MVTDSINEEILRIKHELAAQHGNDVGRIVAHARLSQGHVVTRPPRPYKSDLSGREAQRQEAMNASEWPI